MVIDIPFDLQIKTIDFVYPKTVDIKGYKPTYKGACDADKKGSGGAWEGKSPCDLRRRWHNKMQMRQLSLSSLPEKCRIPVTTTLMGIGAIPAGHELSLGMLGSHGSTAANHAIHNADLLLILGARVGDRAMSTTGDLAKKAKIIHIDIDPC